VHFERRWRGLRPHAIRRLASAGAIAAFVACTDADRSVSPASDAPRDTTRLGLHRPLATDPGPLGSYTLMTPPDNMHSTPWESTGIPLPPNVPIKVTIDGLLTFTTNPGYIQCSGRDPGLPPWGATLGPNGSAGSPPNFRVLLSLTSGGSPLGNYTPSDPGANPVVIYVSLGGQFTLWGAHGNPYGFACGMNGQTYPEWFITGSQTVSAEVLAPPVVTPDKNPAVPGDTVNFTMTVPWATSDTVTGGWQWISDSAAPNPARVRGCGAESTCSYVIYGKGHAQVNGIMAQGISMSGTSSVIQMTVPQLKVTAAPSSVTPGSSITFTAAVTPASASWSISSWTWTPDSGTGGISPNNCTAAEKSCTRAMSLSGWMKATAVIGTYTRSDSTHVSVVPCLAGDSILDDSRIRKALNDAWSGSNPGGSAWNRVERGGVRFLLPNGGVRDSLLLIGVGDNPCGMTFPSFIGAPGVPIVYWHMHPFAPNPGDPLPYDSSLSPRSNCPRIAKRPPPPPGQVYYMPPGPSRTDSLSSLRPHLIVDPENVWFLPSPTDPNHDVKRYPRSGGGVCDPLAQ